MASLLAQQAGETARPCSVEGHEPVAGFLRQGGTEMLQLRHGYGVQVRMALQQVQDIAFIFLRSVSACSVQQEAAGSQTPEGGQQNAPLPLGVASGDGGIETAGVGNAFSQQGLPAARGIRQNEVKTPGGQFRPLVRAQALGVQIGEAAAKQVVAQNAQALRIHFVGNMLLRRYPRLRQNAFPSRRRAHVQAAFRTKRKMLQRGRFPDGRKIQGIVIAAFVIRQGAGFGFCLSGRERQDGGMPPLLRRILCRQGRPVAFRCLRGDDQRASGTVPGLHGVQEIPFLFRRQFQFAGEFEYLGGRHEIRPGMFLRSGC